jgi:hypothetical protein
VKIVDLLADEIQLLEQAKHLAGQITVADQNAVTIFAALLIADAIRESIGQLTRVINAKCEFRVQPAIWWRSLASIATIQQLAKFDAG